MAVPTIVAPTTAATNTVTKPAGGTTNDFYVVVVQGDRGDHPPDISITGFTSVGLGQIGNYRHNIFWRLYTGTEGASFTTAEGTGSARMTAFIVRGADPAQTPLSNAIDTQSPAAASITVTGVTTTVADTLGIIGHSYFGGDADAISASGWTLDTANGRLNVLKQTITSTGATGSVTVSDATVVRQQFGGMIAFAPTSGAAATSAPLDSPGRARRVLSTR